MHIRVNYNGASAIIEVEREDTTQTLREKVKATKLVLPSDPKSYGFYTETGVEFSDMQELGGLEHGSELMAFDNDWVFSVDLYTSTGKVHRVNIIPGLNVKNLKHQIFIRYGIEVDMQRILIETKEKPNSYPVLMDECRMGIFVCACGGEHDARRPVVRQ